MPHLLIASQNPVKIEATRTGFTEMFPQQQFTTEGISVPSGVSDQPMGDEETYQGAWNRVQAARQLRPDADYWIGIEGGNIVNTHGMEVMAWVVIQSSSRIGKARTAGFYLPPKVIDLVNEGYELGHADDLIFGVSNSKQTGGSSGLLTEGVMNRHRFYVPAVVLALIPFLKSELYPAE